MTLSGVIDACRSPTDYTFGENSESSSTTFSPVNGPPLFVNIPEFNELSVIYEEDANSLSYILDSLEKERVSASGNQGLQTSRRRTGKMLRDKKMEGGTSYSGERNNIVSKDPSTTSTSVNSSVWAEGLSPPTLNFSSTEAVLANEALKAPQTASIDAPCLNRVHDDEVLNYAGEDNNDIRSEPGQAFTTSRLRIGIVPLLQLHLDASGRNVNFLAEEKQEKYEVKVESDRQMPAMNSTSSSFNTTKTRIRTQAHTILEQRRHNIRRTKSDSSIKSKSFAGSKALLIKDKDVSVNEVVCNCSDFRMEAKAVSISKKEPNTMCGIEQLEEKGLFNPSQDTTRDLVVNKHCSGKALGTSSQVLERAAQRKPNEGTLSCNNEKRLQENGSSNKTKSSYLDEQPLEVTEAETLPPTGNLHRKSKSTNSTIHGLHRTKDDSGRTVDTSHQLQENPVKWKRNDVTHSSDTEENQPVSSEAKTSLVSNVYRTSQSKIQRGMEPTVFALRKMKLTERQSLEEELTGKGTSKLPQYTNPNIMSHHCSVTQTTDGSNQALDIAANSKSIKPTKTEDVVKPGATDRKKACSSKIAEQIAIFERKTDSIL